MDMSTTRVKREPGYGTSMAGDERRANAMRQQKEEEDDPERLFAPPDGSVSSHFRLFWKATQPIPPQPQTGEPDRDEIGEHVPRYLVSAFEFRSLDVSSLRKPVWMRSKLVSSGEENDKEDSSSVSAATKKKRLQNMMGRLTKTQLLREKIGLGDEPIGKVNEDDVPSILYESPSEAGEGDSSSRRTIRSFELTPDRNVDTSCYCLLKFYPGSKAVLSPISLWYEGKFKPLDTLKMSAEQIENLVALKSDEKKELKAFKDLSDVQDDIDGDADDVINFIDADFSFEVVDEDEERKRQVERAFLHEGDDNANVDPLAFEGFETERTMFSERELLDILNHMDDDEDLVLRDEDVDQKSKENEEDADEDDQNLSSSSSKKNSSKKRSKQSKKRTASESSDLESSFSNVDDQNTRKRRKGASTSSDVEEDDENETGRDSPSVADSIGDSSSSRVFRLDDYTADDRRNFELIYAVVKQYGLALSQLSREKIFSDIRNSSPALELFFSEKKKLAKRFSRAAVKKALAEQKNRR